MDLENNNTVKKLTDADNVVSLSSWKLKKAQDDAPSRYQNYLNALSDFSLMNEVSVFIEEFTQLDLSQQQIRRGKILLNELSKRVQEDSPLLSEAIFQLKQNLVNKLGSLSAEKETTH